MKRSAIALLAALMMVGCAVRRADRLFEAGDYTAAIDAYETMLVRRAELSADDAATLMNLALAYAESESPSYDRTRSEHYLRLLVDLFPRTPQAREADLLLEAVATGKQAELLRLELARRDEQLVHLRAVLQSVAQAENRLRDEVETKDEATADLEGRVARLTRRARALNDEIAALQTELDAIKRIDLESATRTSDPP